MCDVFVRREVVHVWHVVRSELASCPDDGSAFGPWPYVLVGRPGIGKSFGCGSYLLHELLRYDEAKKPVVVYFVCSSAYIFHKTGGVAGRIVFCGESGEVVTAMRNMVNERWDASVERKVTGEVRVPKGPCRAKCSSIIFYEGVECCPVLELPPYRWGCVVLSPPDERSIKRRNKSKWICTFSSAAVPYIKRRFISRSNSDVADGSQRGPAQRFPSGLRRGAAANLTRQARPIMRWELGPRLQRDGVREGHVGVQLAWVTAGRCGEISFLLKENFIEHPGDRNALIVGWCALPKAFGADTHRAARCVAIAGVDANMVRKVVAKLIALTGSMCGVRSNSLGFSKSCGQI
ncbi:putative Retrotransposon hot spot protein [Trypanosoma vivax]|nr:putative Retrotransposon hot spot protein [Trypanosoma vivax]